MFGVYTIRHTESGKQYIGSTRTSFHRRWIEHRSTLNNNRCPNPPLQHAWNKYGEAAFEFVPLEIVSDKADTLAREQWWIDALGYDSLYNCNPTALLPPSQAGRGWTAERRERMRQLMTGRKHTAEARQRMSAAQRLVVRGSHSEERRRKIAEGNRGKKMSREAVEKTRQASTGRRHTAESREQMSKSHRGRRLSEEQRRKIGEALRKAYAEGRRKPAGAAAKD